MWNWNWASKSTPLNNHSLDSVDVNFVGSPVECTDAPVQAYLKSAEKERKRKRERERERERDV